MLTARSQVKEIVKEAGVENLAADFMDKLDDRVKELILKAVKRAKENNRRTVMGKDV